MTVSSIVALLAPLVGLLLFGRLRRLSPLPVEGVGRQVALVIPARNEEASLGNLLRDIENLGVQPDHVVVVDDHSTDATRAIALAFPWVVVEDAPPVPTGWLGKPWACQHGADVAMSLVDGEAVLVFLDADVRLRPDALGALLANAEAGGVVSVQPFHDVPTATEQLSGVFNLVSLMGVGAGTSRPSAIFGPVICCSVADYVRVGGHRSVRSALVEDVELGHRFLAAGARIRVFGGDELVSFRMYPTGLRSMIEGWCKNMAIGAASVPLWRTVAVGWWITGLVMGSTAYLEAVVDVLRATVPATVTILTVLLTSVCLAILLRRVGSFRWWTISLYPALVVFFVVVFLRSTWMTHVRRSVTWRGRTIDLSEGVDDAVARWTP